VFSWGEDHARAEEWGRRGLELGTSAPRRRLTEVLALARLRLGGAAEAERVAGQGLEAFPESPLLHVYRAAALEALSRHEEALAEYREALPLCPNENAAALVRGSIARLEASRGARDAGR
jgi:regulator of sirC expression with transglutaminase-like and TPR domain